MVKQQSIFSRFYIFSLISFFSMRGDVVKPSKFYNCANSKIKICKSMVVENVFLFVYGVDEAHYAHKIFLISIT